MDPTHVTQGRKGGHTSCIHCGTEYYLHEPCPFAPEKVLRRIDRQRKERRKQRAGSR